MKTKWIAAAASLACTAGMASAGTNLVSNGDFGSDPPTAWALGGNTELTAFGAGMFSAGSPYGDGWLSQVLATSSGTRYSISFDIMGDVTSALPDESHFTAYFGETRIYNVLGGVADTHVSELQTATSDATLLQFTYRNDSDWYFLRNVEVVAVPEPEIAATLIAGLTLLGFAGRRWSR